jgi:hypothetical protein
MKLVKYSEEKVKKEEKERLMKAKDENREDE